MTEHMVLPLKPHAGMPPRARLGMPVQDLKHCPPRPRDPASTNVVVARIFTFAAAALLGAAGTAQLLGLLSAGGITLAEALMTTIFAVTFGWMSFGATSALAGFLAQSRHTPGNPAGGLTKRTALVMPVFREDPALTTAALQVMARGLHERGEARAFEIVVLSDSSDAQSWVAETLAVDRLSLALTGIMPVWYRRRWENTARKAGNIKDFVEQWGGRYEHFIVLDADSLMAPETLVALAARMEAGPRLGILQTVPALACGETLFARLQQFAARIYGPVVARGVAAWQGGDGNYWGHNAIIRTRAFAASCGLPELPGRKPLGGAILSHDFVEAALMRRRGWRVEMAWDLDGSWEEGPPSLIDAAVRDRRWAQGNLQHSKVIAARGLSPWSRLHLAMGIMSYAVSPLWLALIGLGLVLSIQARLAPPPLSAGAAGTLDPERNIQLFALTLLVLLLPKLLGLATALARQEMRRSCGGALRLVVSFAAELVASALFAPVLMAIHSRQICEILAGRDSGWTTQRRDGGRTSWADAWRRHRWHTALGALLGVGAWLLSPAILAWLSPIVAGLLLAAPLSRASGSARLGRALRRAGLLATPEELAPHAILTERESALSGALDASQDAVVALATSAAVRDTHYKWASSAPRRRGAPDPAYLTATQKVWEARHLNEALAWLEPRELVHVAGSRVIAEQLAQLPRRAGDAPDAAALWWVPDTDLPLARGPIRSPAA